jgi:integrase
MRPEQSRLIMPLLAEAREDGSALGRCHSGMGRRMLIARSVTEDDDRLTFDTTKTGEERTVPLPRFLAEQITASFDGKGPDDLVFQGTRGGVLHNGNFKVVQQMLRHAAGSV